jgi:hypothetical protein
MRPELPCYQNQTNTHTKMKQLTNIQNEHRCNNSQQNASKLSSTVHQKHYLP